ncbi:MAG: hypothetical protein HY703_04855 [Gemmatimonadetes bacterium]|nr:hypothetical protein [Gemmatimonadota bacterium]
MRTLLLLSALGLLFAAPPAAAQFRQVRRIPETWATVWAGGYHDPGQVTDVTGRWNFGAALAGGLGVHRRVGPGLALGLEGSFASAPYEREDSTGVLVDEGQARLVTGLLSGRLRYGGGDAVSLYLTGGAGAFVYGMPELDRWDPDLALLTGAGLEYRAGTSKAFFLEWGRFWAFHQRAGVKSNSTKHSMIRVGARAGW